MATVKKYKNEKPLDLNPDSEYIKDMKREKSANAAIILMRALANKMEENMGNHNSPYFLSKEGFDELIYAIVSTMELYSTHGWEGFVQSYTGEPCQYEKLIIQAAIDEFENQLDEIDINKGEA